MHAWIWAELECAMEVLGALFQCRSLGGLCVSSPPTDLPVSCTYDITRQDHIFICIPCQDFRTLTEVLEGRKWVHESCITTLYRRPL